MSRSSKSGDGSHDLRTRAVHGPGGTTPGPVSTPIVHSATFSFPSLEAMNRARDQGRAGAYYQRIGHPTLRAVEARLASLAGAEDALLFSSGMAAISAVFLTLLKPGDHVLALQQTYGGTTGLLRWGTEHCGWEYDLIDARTPEAWPKAFRPGTRFVHVETPTNPTLAVVDLAKAAELAHAQGALLALDNTVASPIGQLAFEHGVDFVACSATKSIGGHADLLGGVVFGAARALDAVAVTRKILGPVPDPQLAWQIERSLKTLPLRVAAQNANALELARRLDAHPGVRTVFYPGLPSHPGHQIARAQMREGFGPLMSFDVEGGAPAAAAVVNALRVVLHAPSLGGVESLVSLPAETSHVQLTLEERRAAGIPDGLVRFSVGIEAVEDLWADLEQALAAAAPVRA